MKELHCVVIYRPQLTSMLSLCHRVTGIAMALSKYIHICIGMLVFPLIVLYNAYVESVFFSYQGTLNKILSLNIPN